MADLNKINVEPDLWNIVVALIALVLNIATEQKNKNIVLTNGNNNEVQIPNEQGPGSNTSIDRTDVNRFYSHNLKTTNSSGDGFTTVFPSPKDYEKYDKKV